MTINCEFFNKVNLGGFLELPDYEFQNMNCEVETGAENATGAIEFIEQNGKSFFLDKTISYGDFLILLF